MLTDDEVSAITANAYELVGKVQYENISQQVTDKSFVIVWRATVQVNIDDSEIQSWLNLDTQNKAANIVANKNIQSAFANNEAKVEILRARAETASTAKDIAEVKAEFAKTDEEFLYNKKLEQAIRLMRWEDDFKYELSYELRAKTLAKAIEILSEAIPLKPNDGLAYYYRGKAYETINLTNDEPYTKKIFAKLFPGVVKNGLIQYDFQRKDFDKAIECFTKAIEENPADDVAYYHRALTYFNYTYESYGDAHERSTTHKRKALDDLTTAVEINPNNAWYYFYRRSLRAYLQNEFPPPEENAKDLADLTKAIEIAPDNYYFYYARGHLYQDMGENYQDAENYRLAVADYLKVTQLYPNYFLAWEHLKECYRKLGDKAAADFAKRKYKAACERIKVNISKVKKIPDFLK